MVTVVAPAGYGKTTLLTQWSEHARNQLAWLSADDAENDPAVLCTEIAAALDSVAPLGSAVFGALAAQRHPAALASVLVEVVETIAVPFTLVIDQLEFVTNPECLDIIRQLAVGLSDGARLVLSSRVQPRLPVPRLRAQGRLLEIGIKDLALSAQEARALLLAAGVENADHDVDGLIDRTEGWPAGLYLAAIAANVGNPDPGTAFELSGDNRFVGDYLRDEVLDRLSPEDASFLKQASILDIVSGPLCDATLDTTGSAARLEAFENRNLLVVPLDDRREWYRFHRLFGELLRSELHRHEPELEAQLHARAAAWHQANGRPEQALEHARAANDNDLFALLLSDLIQPVWASGRVETVQRWLEWLAQDDVADRHPELAVHGALMYALLGHPAHMETWASAAERSDTSGATADGSSIASILGYLRAFLCRDGIAAMRSDSILAYDGLAPTSPYRAGMLFTEAQSYLVEGDTERAEPVLLRSADAAMAIGSIPLAAMVYAVLGQIAATRDDWAEATKRVERALGLLADGTFDDYWSSAPVFAVGAWIAIQSGRIDTARTLLIRGARLRPLMTYALPVMSVFTLLETARSYVALTDRAGATVVLRQAHGILQQRPGLGQLGGQVAELSARVESGAIILAGGTSLTAAELRLVPFLATHLTLQEIGDRLYISRSTAKTEAVSIYHKLGVGSRGEAVDLLRELGLLRP